MQVLTNIWSVLFFPPVSFVLIGASLYNEIRLKRPWKRIVDIRRENMFYCELKWTCVSLGEHIESCDPPVTSLPESRQVQAAISNQSPSSSPPCHASADGAMMNGVHTVNHLKCELHNCCLELTLILSLISLNGRRAEICDVALHSPAQEGLMGVWEQSTEVQCSCILFYYKSTIRYKWHKEEHETWKIGSIKALYFKNKSYPALSSHLSV